MVSSWYLGRRPPAFDLLAWNADATRLPAAMHSQFLRACYLDNLLPAAGAFEIDGTPVDTARIDAPLYVLGAETDHITPWRSSYRTTQLVGGEARYTLTTSGHVAGIVRPPGTKRSAHWVRDDVAPDAEEWRRGATHVEGSWWDDWAAWADTRFGARVPAPALPPGEPAPGSYVAT